MSNDAEEPEDQPLALDERARIDAMMREHELASEKEATRTYGPPEVWARKNRRYAQRLVRMYSEQAIRGMLKALAVLDEPMCCQNLRMHNLDAAPLETVIQPFDRLGFQFRILSASTHHITVDIGEAYGTVGSGGQVHLERLSNDRFRIVDVLQQWIA